MEFRQGRIELLLNERPVLLGADVEDGAEMFVRLFKMSFIPRGIKLYLKQGVKSLGNMIAKLAVDLEIERHQVIVIDIFQLARGKPNIIAIRRAAIGHFHAEGDDPVEDVECIGRPSLTIFQIDHALRRMPVRTILCSHS